MVQQEPEDRNKSSLTHRVTRAASLWLDNHGFKPVETEVWLESGDINGKGWIADLAAVICPTQTELINMKMIPRRPPWGKVKEVREAWEEQYRALDRMMTCIVEVKTSRNDFVRDRKWKATPPSDLAFIAIPHGIVAESFWPKNWGVLEYRKSTLVKLRNPVPRISTVNEKLGLIYQIAIRRDHRTRYKVTRQWAKTCRVREAEEKHTNRIGKLINAFEAIASGRINSIRTVTSVQQTLEYYGIRGVNSWQLESLGKLFKIAAKEEDHEHHEEAV